MTPQIYTKTGDDGTTGLYFGGRVRKDSIQIDINGVVDEAQAAMGLARAESAPGSELNERLTALERELYVLMAEVATAPDNRRKLKAGSTLVTAEMVAALEQEIDHLRTAPTSRATSRSPGRTDVPPPSTCPHDRAPGGAVGGAGTGGGFAGRAVPQSPVGSAVGDGAVAGGSGSQALSRLTPSASDRRRALPRAYRRPL